MKSCLDKYCDCESTNISEIVIFEYTVWISIIEL